MATVLLVVLGMSSVLLYGTSDFFGGLASRTQPAVRVTLVAFVLALVGLAPALFIGRQVLSPPAVLFGGLAGVFAAVGVWAFYAALAAGPVGFVAPVTAILCAVLPSVWAFAFGEQVPPLVLVALAVVVAGGVLLSLEPDVDRRPAVRTVVLTLVAGVTYGAYFVVMDATPTDSGGIPMIADTVVGIVVIGAAVVFGVLRGERPPAPSGREWGVMVAAGLTQGVASGFLVFALHLPGLAIVSALSALYPLATVALTVGVLHERIRPIQAAGIVLAIAGVAVLALARA